MRKQKTSLRAIFFSVRVMLIILVMLVQVGWDLPFMSQRNRGDNDFANGNFERAIAHYTNAIEQDGSDWELYYNLGTSYYRAGEYQGAIDQLEIAFQIAERRGASDYNKGKILHNTGLAYLQMDDCENAIPVLTEAARFAGPDDDIQNNLEFATQYCEEGPPDAPQTEGEEEDEGEGDEEDELQGQNEGESNDENEAENESDAEEGEDEEGGTDESEGENDENQDNEDQEQEGSEGEDGEEDSQEQEGQEGDQDESVEEGEGDEEQEQESEGENEGEEENAGGEEESDEEEGGGQNENAEERGPNEVPSDGLNMSDARIQEILDWMANRERMNAPRYFNNQPQPGDILDEETLAELIQRFFGAPASRSDDIPDDGIDW